MANKSSKKHNSNMSALWSLLTLVFAGAVLGFLALPAISLEVINTTRNTSCYDLLYFGDGANTGLAVVILLLVIFASLLALFAIIKLLADLKVIKNSTFAKIASFGMLLSAVAVAVLVIVNCIMVPIYASDLNNPINFGYYASWAGLILNVVLGVASLMTSALSLRKK